MPSISAHNFVPRGDGFTLEEIARHFGSHMLIAEKWAYEAGLRLRIVKVTKTGRTVYDVLTLEEARFLMASIHARRGAKLVKL